MVKQDRENTMEQDFEYRFNFNTDFLVAYKLSCNHVFEKKATELGIYKVFKGDTRGVVGWNGKWCWRNTINTHLSCGVRLVKLYREKTGETLDFKTSYKSIRNLEKLFKFVEENFELFFTPNIELTYYHEFWLLCSKSWGAGQLTTLALLYKIEEFFPNIDMSRINFSLERGEVSDFQGKDMTLYYKDSNDPFSIQIKSGKLISKIDEYIINGSKNDLSYTTEYYCYVDIGYFKTAILIFNNSEKPKKINYNIYVQKTNMHQLEICEEIMVPQLLMEITKFCVNKNIIFELSNENTVPTSTRYEEKPFPIFYVTINNIFNDIKDPDELLTVLTDGFNDLKDRFQ